MDPLDSVQYSSSEVKWRSEAGGGQSINSSSLTKSIECGFVGGEGGRGEKSREASAMSSQLVWFTRESACSAKGQERPFAPDVILQIVAEPRTRPGIISNLSAPSFLLSSSCRLACSLSVLFHRQGEGE